MTMMKKIRLIVPCRVAYLNCWEPASQYGGDKYFSLTAIVSKDDGDAIALISGAVEKLRREAASEWNGMSAENIKNPIHDGDVEKPGNPIYKNTLYFSAKSKTAPQIVDCECKTITEQNELYSGCFANVSFTLHAYNCGGIKGISAWLGNIQKICDGERIGGKILATEEFKPISVMKARAINE